VNGDLNTPLHRGEAAPLSADRAVPEAGAGTTRGARLVGRIPERLRMPLGMAALAEAGYLVWWAAFYPGLFSYDSFTYSQEVTTGHWIADHSIAYDGAVWLSLVGTGDYSALTLTQTFAMAAVIGYLAAGLRRFGVRTRWIALSVLLSVILPSTSAFVIYVWKDVPFAIGSVLAFAAVVHLVAGTLREERYHSRSGTRGTWLLLGLGLLLICLARNNGFLAAFLIGLALLAVLPRLWKRITAVVLVPVVCFFALSDGLYPALGVTKPLNNAAYSFFYGDIAYAYSKHPGSFTAADRAVLLEVAPLSHWSTYGAACYDIDGLLQGSFDLPKAVQINSRLMHVFTEVAERTPVDVVQSTMCRSHPAWSVLQGSDPLNVAGVTVGPDLVGYVPIHPDIRQDKYFPEMSIRPLSGTLNKAGRFWFEGLRRSWLVSLVWGGAFWAYVAYAISGRLFAGLRRRELFALGAVTLGNQLNVIAANPAPLYRYLASPTYIGVLMLPLLFAARSDRRKQPDAVVGAAAEAVPGTSGDR